VTWERRARSQKKKGLKAAFLDKQDESCSGKVLVRRENTLFPSPRETRIDISLIKKLRRRGQRDVSGRIDCKGKKTPTSKKGRKVLLARGRTHCLEKKKKKGGSKMINHFCIHVTHGGTASVKKGRNIRVSLRKGFRASGEEGEKWPKRTHAVQRDL